MWSQLTLVTDAELGALEPEAIASAAPWGATTWVNARNEAKRDLKIWLERDFARKADITDSARRTYAAIALPAITDRIQDAWSPDWVFQYTGATYTDRTTAARDDQEKDIDLSTVFVSAANDRLYVGALYEFEGLQVTLLDALNANASVATVKYWGGTGWKTISATDGTAVTGKTFAQTGRLTWTMPTDWAPRRLNGTGDELFWIEISISATLTAGTAATQLLPVRAPDGLKRVCAYLALGHIFRGLAPQAAEPDAWLKRVKNADRTGYEDRAEDLYASLRDNGGIPIDLNANQTIEPQERYVQQPLRLGRG